MSKLINDLIPPGFLKLCQRFEIFKLAQMNFKSWWRSYKISHDIPADLIVMVDHFVASASFPKSSKYWNYLNMVNIKQITEGGYNNFKQTVARNYFTWVKNSLENLYSKNLTVNTGSQNLAVKIKELLKKHSMFSLDESLFYNTITCLLYEFVKNAVPPEIFDFLEEPMEGNPPSISIEGRNISQDILNSALEVNSILKGVDLYNTRSIVEIGAGSGRTSYCLMKIFPRLKYVISDIPPALYISQTYLSNQFPNQKIFKFRPFDFFGDVRKEFEAAHIIFITPDQLKFIPDKFADLFLAIDCLHEMKKVQVQEYFNQADRLAHNIYYKCWNTTIVRFDRIKYTVGDYPVKPNWQKIFQTQCQIPTTFFEAFYRINL